MFNIIQGSKGAEASDITGANGGAVQGSEYARPKNVNKSQPPMPYRGKMNENSSMPLNSNRRERNPVGINGGGSVQNSYRNQRQSSSNMAGGRRNFNDQHDDDIISNNQIKPNGYTTGRVHPNMNIPNNNGYPQNQYGDSSHFSGGRLDRQSMSITEKLI